jgi:hypothetical protein
VSEVARIAAAIDEAFKARRSAGVQDLIGELATALTVAATSIDRLGRQPCHHPPEAAPGADRPSGLPGTRLALEEVLVALETDDPGIVEPVLDRLSASLSPDDTARLRGLIDDFDFEEAKALVADFARESVDIYPIVH